MNMEKERRGRWKDFLNNKFGQQSIILSLFSKVFMHFTRGKRWLLDRGGDLEVGASFMVATD